LSLIQIRKNPFRPKSGKVKKIFNKIILKVKNFSLNFRVFFESENSKSEMIESKKISTKLLEVKNLSLSFRVRT